MTKFSSKLDWNKMLGFEQIADDRNAARIGPKVGGKADMNVGFKVGAKIGSKNLIKIGAKIGSKNEA